MSVNTTNKVVINRINDVYYIQINGGTTERLGTYLGSTFNETTVLGASIDGNGNPWRYFKGTLSNITIIASEAESYTIQFNANGGTGTMNNQDFFYANTQNLNSNLFIRNGYIFRGWNTKSDGSGTFYENNQSVRNLTNTENDIVDLYAMWAEAEYQYNGEYVFTGSNYLDTGIYLFSEGILDKDFDISFEIVSRDTTTFQATIMSAMDESGSPWPGIVYRVQSANEDNLAANVNGSIKTDKKYNKNGINKVMIKRRSGVIYVNFNDGTDERLLDMTSLTTTFDSPLIFGCSLDGSGNPQRYFTGKLKNMSVLIYE